MKNPSFDLNVRYLDFDGRKIEIDYISSLCSDELIAYLVEGITNAKGKTLKDCLNNGDVKEELNKENPKIAQIMSDLITEIEKDEEKYKGQSILHIVEDTKKDCIDQVITDFCYRWFASKEDIMYAATHYRNGEIPNESAIRTTVDYASYKKAQEKAIPKFKYYAKLFEELRKTLDEEIEPLMIS